MVSYGRSPTPRHKVFLSYHHRNDQAYKDQLVTGFGYGADFFVDHSVGADDIDDTLSTERISQLIRDNYLRDATVTVVLIGVGTWRRKHVDWEIDSSLRATKQNPRNGLLGLLLPTYRVPVAGVAALEWADPKTAQYWPRNVPPRLWDNVSNGYAKIRPWPGSGAELQQWIHEAFQRRNMDPPPNLRRDRFGNNRPDTASGWHQ